MAGKDLSAAPGSRDRCCAQAALPGSASRVEEKFRADRAASLGQGLRCIKGKASTPGGHRRLLLRGGDHDFYYRFAGA